MNKDKPKLWIRKYSFPLIQIIIKNPRLSINRKLPLKFFVNPWPASENTPLN